jgi:hypothetical protein
VNQNKTVLIITDGADSTAVLAEKIKAALGGYNVILKTAADFSGTDLLGASLFFVGCEKPDAFRPGYFSKVLKHINLASRPCGIFSSDGGKAVEYLTDLLRDCEAALNPRALTAKNAEEVNAWVEKTAKGGVCDAKA